MKGEEDDMWGSHVNEVSREVVEGFFSLYGNTVRCAWPNDTKDVENDISQMTSKL